MFMLSLLLRLNIHLDIQNQLKLNILISLNQVHKCSTQDRTAHDRLEQPSWWQSVVVVLVVIVVLFVVVLVLVGVCGVQRSVVFIVLDVVIDVVVVQQREQLTTAQRQPWRRRRLRQRQLGNFAPPRRERSRIRTKPEQQH